MRVRSKDRRVLKKMTRFNSYAHFLNGPLELSRVLTLSRILQAADC